MSAQPRSTNEWEGYEDEILNLYYEENFDLPKLRRYMKEKYGLNKTYVKPKGVNSGACH